MLAKLNLNLKKDFESISIKWKKNLNKLILFSTSISHELETHNLQIKLWYNLLKKWFLIIILLKDIQLLKAFRIKFQKCAAHAHKDALINETFIAT